MTKINVIKIKKCIWNENICVDNICPNAKDKETCENNSKYADLFFGTVIMEQNQANVNLNPLN